MDVNDDIDVRKLRQETLAAMVMTYHQCIHNQTAEVNRITAEFMQTGKVEAATMRAVTTSLATIHECLSADVLMLVEQDKQGLN